MASNTTMIKKLQRAINLMGGRITYHTGQFYSEQQDRPVTIYTIKKAVWDEDKKKNRNIELFSSYSQIQIVLFLRDYLYQLQGKEIPTDNEMWEKAKEQYSERQLKKGN